MPLTEVRYLRKKAQQALRRARESPDKVLVKSLIEDAAQYLGRAEALDLVERLKDFGKDLAQD